MCKNYIKITDGKIDKVIGKFTKGTYTICLECEGIFKVLKNSTKEIARIVKIK